MGIRVNKLLGYGLTDVKTEGLKIVDERFNPDGYLGCGFSRQNSEFNFASFMEFWKENQAKKWSDFQITEVSIRESVKSGKSQYPEMYRSVAYESESGLPNVMVVTPPSCINHGWRRRDDIIDWCEETEIYNGESRILTMPFGIFPWSGSFCHADGERWVGLQHSLVLEFMRKDRFETRESLSKELGFSSVEEAQKDILPLIPEEVQVLCKYLKLFNDEKTIRTLIPMMYVYWS